PGTVCLRGSALREPGLIADGAVVIEGETIAWVGRTADLPPLPEDAQVLDLEDKVVVPGFVDSHTHLIFSGDRVEAFEQRLGGMTYQEISARGGGITSTVRRVRAAAREDLIEQARWRLLQLLSFGVTTVEVKSGYGLTLDDELKCLRAIADLNAEGPWELVPTFLVAHAVPLQHGGDRAVYLRLACE